MAYNDDVRLVDVFGGMQDLNHHLIRCVGDPRERFSEDALRILRAVRFSAQLDFPIEPDTAKAVKELAPNLKNISAERIQTELVKLLTSPHPERIQDACELGITKVVLPEWDAMVGVKQNTIHHKYDVAEHTLHTLKHVKRDKYLRLTMLFHDMGKPAMKTTDEKGNDHFKGHALESEKIARTVLKRLKFDNETIRIVTKLVCYHDYRMEATPANVRRAMNRIGVELFPSILFHSLQAVEESRTDSPSGSVCKDFLSLRYFQSFPFSCKCFVILHLQDALRDSMGIIRHQSESVRDSSTACSEWKRIDGTGDEAGTRTRCNAQ